MIETHDAAFYTGITTDIERRFAEHCEGNGAKFFRIHSPKRIAYIETFPDRSSASRREREIKNLSAREKESLVKIGPPRLHPLSGP